MVKFSSGPPRRAPLCGEMYRVHRAGGPRLGGPVQGARQQGARRHAVQQVL